MKKMTKLKCIVWMAAMLAMIAFGQIANAQQCGPGCPACSGKAIGDLLPPNTIFGSGLFIPNGEDETAVYNVRYGLFSWLDIGVGYAQEADEIIWSARV